MDMIRALLNSRKFWLGVLGVVGAVILYAQGAIEASELVDAILVLVGALMATIAIEDAAEKNARGRENSGQMMVGGDFNEAENTEN